MIKDILDSLVIEEVILFKELLNPQLELKVYNQGPFQLNFSQVAYLSQQQNKMSNKFKTYKTDYKNVIKQTNQIPNFYQKFTNKQQKEQKKQKNNFYRKIKRTEKMSNSGEISFELYKWLSSLQIITTNQKYKSSGNIQLDSKLYDDLMSGSLMAKLVQILSNQLKIPLNGPLLSSIKKSNTPAARVYNWNILNQSYSKIGIFLSKQMQKQITSGNFDQFKRFLIEIQHKMIPKKIQKQFIKQDSNTELDFQKIQKYQEFQQCQTVLQTIVKIISKTCGLTVKQAFSTLSQNLKYLSHMIVKGIKNSYQQIQTFFQTILENMPHLIFLTQKDPATNTSFLLQVLKPSLISREPSVALIGSQALKAFIYQSLKYNSKNLIYQILTSHPSGFDFIYMGVKRHPQLSNIYIEFIHRLVQNAYRQFFEVHLRNLINNESQYIKTIIILLDGIKVMQQSKKKVIESGLLKIWVKTCEQNFNLSGKSKKQLGSSNQQVKILSLELMSDLWKIFGSELDENEAEDLLMKGIEQLKKNTRKDNYMIKISALNRLFDFLDYLANQKNRLASTIYKKIIFLFIENHQDGETRQVILQNFSLILKKYPTIPLEFLLQPLLKQLINSEGQTYILNIFDFQFFIQLFKHPKMEPAFALNFLQYFTKLYTKNVIYSTLSLRIIQLLASRYCQQEAITEYIVKNVDSSLNSYGILAVGKKTYAKSREDIIMKNQKKSLIIELLKFYIRLQSDLISSSIKSKVLKLYIQWIDTRNYQDKGLYSLLTLFGDLDQMIMKERIEQQNTKIQVFNNLTSKTRNSPSLVDSNHNNLYTPLAYGNVDSSSSRIKVNKINQNNKPLVSYDSFREETYQKANFDLGGSGSKKAREYPNLLEKQSRFDDMVDPKTLEDIELYKKKYQREQQRKKKLLQKDNQPQIIKKVNTAEMIQRQVSLGYNKIFALKQIKPEELIFEFDTVKTKHLKEETQMIDLQTQEQRDIQSTNKVFKKYQKQIQTLFYKYTALGHIGNRSPTLQKVILTLTDLSRMLKQKNLNKLPKIMINEIITYINRKKKYNANLLIGIEEESFNLFLILFTNLYIKDQRNQKDQPFGHKVEKILFKLFQGQIFTKQINDKKAEQWFNENKISQIPFQQHKYIPAPQGYKKVNNQEVTLIYKILNTTNFDISLSYEHCIQVVQWLLNKALGINIISPMSKTNMLTRIVPIIRVPKPKIPQALTQKNLKRATQLQTPIQYQKNEFDLDKSAKQEEKPKSIKNKKSSQFKISSIVRAKSHKEINSTKKINKTEVTEQQLAKKRKLQQEYGKKLRDDLQLLRKQKQKKNEIQKQKKQQEDQKIQLKQQKHKKYLQQNKKKIQQKKQIKQQETKKQQMTNVQEKVKKKEQLKEKQKQLLQKQQKKIQQKKQKFDQIKKSKQKKIKVLQSLQKKAKNSINQKKQTKNQEKQKQKRLLQIIHDKTSQLNKILSSYEKELKLLFEEYWNWKIQKIQLKDIALVMKNFKVSPEYVSPKMLSQVFKSYSKGDALSLDQFKEILAFYSYKSVKLLQQTNLNTGKQFESQVLKRFLGEKLKMKSMNYQQIIKQAKLQQL